MLRLLQQYLQRVLLLLLRVRLQLLMLQVRKLRRVRLGVDLPRRHLRRSETVHRSGRISDAGLRRSWRLRGVARLRSCWSLTHLCLRWLRLPRLRRLRELGRQHASRASDADDDGHVARRRPPRATWRRRMR